MNNDLQPVSDVKNNAIIDMRLNGDVRTNAARLVFDPLQVK